MSRLPVLLSALLACAALAAPAAAATYCVAPESSCPPGMTYATIPIAFGQTGSTPEADKIQLGAATYTAPSTAGFDYGFLSPVEIAGRGNSTILTGPAGTATVLNLSNPTSGSLHDLRITLPANTTAGSVTLQTKVDTTRVTLDASATQTNAYKLVNLMGGADFAHGTVTADTSGAYNTVGIGIQDAGSSVTDTVAVARTPIQDGSAGGSIIDRVHVTGYATGIEPGPGTAVRNCLVNMPQTANNAAIGVYSAGVTITNCTLVGSGSGSVGYGVYVSGAFTDSSATVANTVIRGVAHTLFANSNGVHSAGVTAHHSAFDPALASIFGAGTLTLGSGNVSAADVRMLDEPGGDYRPRYDSPLVDAGDPATPNGADLQNYARRIDGDGVGGPVVDIGAYEYPRQGAEAEIDGPTAGDAGVELTWTGSASDPDPGETPLLTYGWRIDGGAVEPGAVLHHTFTTGGTYQLQLVVTDPAGAVGTLDYLVVITGPAPPAPGGGTPDPGAPPPGGGDPAVPPGGGQSGGGDVPGGGAVPPKRCVGTLRFSALLDRRLKTAHARLAGKALKVRRRHGRLSVHVDLRHRKPGVYRLRVVGRTAKGKRLVRTRRYRVCA
jgi:hypothetical protein